LHRTSKMILKVFSLIALTAGCLSSVGQDTLPGFTVINRGSERIIISWTNPYAQNIRQLSIQRSFDSLRNYKTILTVPDPTAPQNGYVDTKATNDHMFYRLYILLDSGRYIFSAVEHPGIDNGNANTNFQNISNSGEIIAMNKLRSFKAEVANANERIIFVKRKETLVGFIAESALKSFRDYANSVTKDTIFMKAADTLVILPYVAKEYFRPSRYVFTEKDGNIKILLDQASSRKYGVKFFEEDDTEVFEIKQIKEPLVILDKTNFIHSGWFTFELYEDGKLKEKHKFYVPKDF